MGSTNALAAYARWGDKLPHRARHVLVYMALRSLDHEGEKGQPARLYFAGPDELATAIGYDVSTAEGRHAGLNKVADDIALLMKIGAVERVERGRSGHRAVYRLRVDVIPSTTATVVQKDHRHGGDSTTATGVSSPPPRWSLGEEGATEDNEEEPASSSPSVPHQGPANAMHADDDDEAYRKAREHVASLGPERHEQLQAWVQSEHPNADTRTRVLAMAEHAQAGGR